MGDLFRGYASGLLFGVRSPPGSCRLKSRMLDGAEARLEVIGGGKGGGPAHLWRKVPFADVMANTELTTPKSKVLPVLIYGATIVGVVFAFFTIDSVGTKLKAPDALVSAVTRGNAFARGDDLLHGL